MRCNDHDHSPSILRSWYGIYFLRGKLMIDDALDVRCLVGLGITRLQIAYRPFSLPGSSVHGITGIVGSIYIGFAARINRHEFIAGGGVIVGSHGKLLGVQVWKGWSLVVFF